MRRPTMNCERELARLGHTVIGVDEVGCGCVAGPVIAAAIHVPLNLHITGIADSKLLTHKKREEIFTKFLEKNVHFTLGIATVAEVEKLNVRRASLLAMKRAVDAFEGATYVLVDAWTIPGIPLLQRGIIHGDRLVRCIAAASIVAKVVRDHMMTEFDMEFPGYCFAQHKGYGTALHRSALKKRGISPIHRRTFLKKWKVAS